MEAALPEGAMVFQLPAGSYPEAGTTHRMPDYAHMACHAYSGTLRWSFGTNRNRRWDEWHKHVAGLPPPEMVKALSLAGFAGVYVDRRGFADNGDAVIGDLRGRLGPEVAASHSGEQLLFSLAPAVEDLRRYVDPADWEREKSRLLDRPCVLCQDGFFLWTAKMADEPWRAMHRAAMRLVNPGRETRSVTLSMAWRRMAADEIRVRVSSQSLGVDQLVCPPTGRGIFELEIELPPGEHVLRFDTTPKPVGLPRMFVAWDAADVKLIPRD